jgi:hypothetical protein
MPRRLCSEREHTSTLSLALVLFCDGRTNTMASSSSNVNEEIQSLLNLQRRGLLTAVEFARMSADIMLTDEQRVTGLAEARAHDESSRSSEDEDEDEDEQLVDEDGRPLSPGPSGLPTSNTSPHEGGAAASRSASSRSPSLPHTPSESPSEKPPDIIDGPHSWEPRTEVMSSDHGSVIFLRLGNVSDFVNNGRAKIVIKKSKPGAKFKKVDHEIWVKPETLHRPAPEPVEASPQRKSPRVALQQQQRPRAADLPTLAGHERDRKLPKKKEAAVHGHHGLGHTTKESNVSPEDRIKTHPGHTLCINPLNGKVRCGACKVDLFNKASSISSHCKMETRPGQPTKHAIAVEKFLQRVEDDAETKQGLLDYFK